MLLAEAGVHRLVRISPFDQASRRHTSFASVFVWPELPEDVEIEIEDKDLRDRHLPVERRRRPARQRHRFGRPPHAHPNRHRRLVPERAIAAPNRDAAMKVLKARLYDLKMKEQQAKLDQLGGEKKDIAFGSQIRSYVLHPYQLIKDHRTKEEVGDVNRVLDGDLDGFIKVVFDEEGVGNAWAGRAGRGVVGEVARTLVHAGASRSARASRFAAWKTDPSRLSYHDGVGLGDPGAGKASVRQRIESDDRRRIGAAAVRKPLRARLVSSIVTPLKVGPTRPARAGGVPRVCRVVQLGAVAQPRAHPRGQTCRAAATSDSRDHRQAVKRRAQAGQRAAH